MTKSGSSRVLEPKWGDRESVPLYLHNVCACNHADTTRERKHIPGK
jgi:hypothetical protein